MFRVTAYIKLRNSSGKKFAGASVFLFHQNKFLHVAEKQTVRVCYVQS